jgi:hypothetical protein
MSELIKTYDPKIKILADSISEEGVRIVSIQSRFPRFVLAELNTHGALSKSARSSRAVPVKKIIEEVKDGRYIPHFLKNKPGMVAEENLSVEDFYAASHIWDEILEFTIDRANKLADLNVHKQYINRLLEPFMFVDSIVTATDWANFLALRTHKDALPEFRILALGMQDAINNSTPKQIEYGSWHLPYIKDEEYFGEAEQYAHDNDLNTLDVLCRISAARCARVSYSPFDGNSTIQKELDRFDFLMGGELKHVSPCNHQATPDKRFGPYNWYLEPNLHGNFYGWKQFRKMIPNNTVYDRK